MVAELHQLAVGVNASYDIEVGGVKTTLTNPATSKTYEVDATLLKFNRIFMQTCLLSYRHVLYMRSKANCEIVIPPMQTFATGWIVLSQANNIDKGV
ncbi:hypothetical protein PHMEG_00017829 [Phytophthora megakarya]|uniref:Uncharacterized protein n=1 Tax=Phytophthora megakarya TaxID=4795 RepID=A0A225VVJ6_9STRA|nr:hypothetical protein PHMEG_00017829 [Phytophthora megakarya]